MPVISLPEYLGISEAPQQPVFQRTRQVEPDSPWARTMQVADSLTALRNQRPMAQIQAIQNEYDMIRENAEKLRREREAAMQAEQAVGALLDVDGSKPDYLERKREIQKQFPLAQFDPRFQGYFNENDQIYRQQREAEASLQREKMKLEQEKAKAYNERIMSGLESGYIRPEDLKPGMSEFDIARMQGEAKLRREEEAARKQRDEGLTKERKDAEEYALKKGVPFEMVSRLPTVGAIYEAASGLGGGSPDEFKRLKENEAAAIRLYNIVRDSNNSTEEDIQNAEKAIIEANKAVRNYMPTSGARMTSPVSEFSKPLPYGVPYSPEFKAGAMMAGGGMTMPPSTITPAVVPAAPTVAPSATVTPPAQVTQPEEAKMVIPPAVIQTSSNIPNLEKVIQSPEANEDDFSKYISNPSIPLDKKKEALKKFEKMAESPPPRKDLDLDEAMMRREKIQEALNNAKSAVDSQDFVSKYVNPAWSQAKDQLANKVEVFAKELGVSPENVYNTILKNKKIYSPKLGRVSVAEAILGVDDAHKDNPLVTDAINKLEAVESERRPWRTFAKQLLGEFGGRSNAGVLRALAQEKVSSETQSLPIEQPNVSVTGQPKIEIGKPTKVQ